MRYIVFDLEFNQDVSGERFSKSLFEIIQIGAIKLDSNFNTLDTFSHLVKPTIYKNIAPPVTDLTGITLEHLQSEKHFPEVFHDFNEFIGGSDAVFCSWGLSDIRVLFKNVDYYKLDQQLLPRMFINLQPHTSRYLGLSSKKLLQLQTAVEALNIPKKYDFHHALYDAYYTSEILKKINPSSIQPQLYDPSYVIAKPRQKKQEIDFDGLIEQFEKMYARSINEEEKAMIKLAYQMGRTHQFLK